MNALVRAPRRRRWPPRGLHLPPPDELGRVTIWCGVLIGAAVAAGGLIRWAPEPSADWEQRAAVALMLFGQRDPDAVMAAGLHGLGARPVRVTIGRLADCRFKIATTDRSEIIDFRQVTLIRHASMADPAAGVAFSLQPGPIGIARLPVAILAGRGDAFCGEAGCVDRRVFALADEAMLGAASAAATSFRQRSCPASCAAVAPGRIRRLKATAIPPAQLAWRGAPSCFLSSALNTSARSARARAKATLAARKPSLEPVS